MIGTDIETISRFLPMTTNAAALASFLTDKERQYWTEHGSKVETLAGLWCVKEAVVKALGMGFGVLGYHDVEVRHTQAGSPYAVVDSLRMIFEVSISHTIDTCIAIAMKQ